MDGFQMDYVDVFLTILAVWGISALLAGGFFLRRILVAQRRIDARREQFHKEWFEQ